MRDLEGTQAAARSGRGRRARGPLAAAVGLVVAVVGLSLVAVACSGGEEAPSVEIYVLPDDPKALGPVDAAVTVIEYADFQ